MVLDGVDNADRTLPIASDKHRFGAGRRDCLFDPVVERRPGDELLTAGKSAGGVLVNIEPG